MTGAVVYCRVSSLEQVRNLSLATQRERCSEFCQRNGWTIVETFVEQGESAKTTDRTELALLLKFCREHRGRVSYVVVYAVSRLARNTHDHHVLRAVLAGCGVQLRSVTEPIEDSSAGRFIETMLAAAAQLDNDTRSERTVAGLKASLARGRWPFMAPLGYVNARIAGVPTLLHDADRAPLIRRAFELVARGGTTAEAFRMLRDEGFKGRQGPLSMDTVSRLLASPAYKGTLEVPTWGASERGAFVPIVDESTWSAAQAMLLRRRHAAPVHARSHPDFPLRHFAQCGRCGRPLTGAWSTGRGGKRYAYYNCPNGPCATNVKRDTLEASFVEQLALLQPTPAYLRLFRAVVLDHWRTSCQEARQAAAGLRRRVEDVQQRQERLVEAFVYQRAVDRATYDAQSAKLREDLALAQMALQDADLDSIDVEGLLAYFEHLASNVADQWRQASHELRLQLQAFVFPRGIEWLDGRIRTAVIGWPFSYLAEVSGEASEVGSPRFARFEPAALSEFWRALDGLRRAA